MMSAALEAVVGYLRQAKAEGMVLLDFGEGMGPVADRVLIATATAATHLRALAEGVHLLLKRWSVVLRTEYGEGWIVIDCGEEMIHLFLREKREFYALEDLWGMAKRLELG